VVFMLDDRVGFETPAPRRPAWSRISASCWRWRVIWRSRRQLDVITDFLTRITEAKTAAAPDPAVTPQA